MKYFVILLIFVGFFGMVFAVPEIYPDLTGSYELTEALCIGGPGMVLDENCQRVLPSPYNQQQDGIDPEQVKCNGDLYRSYKTSDGSAFCASGFALKELIHRGYAEAFDSIGSSTIGSPNDKATQYCPAGQELTQWGWYGEKYPDVIVTNIDLNYDPDEDSYGVEFTFDPTNNPETDGKSMVWVFVECDSTFDNDFGNMGYEWSASYYPNKRPLPNGTFDDNLENVIPWLMMQELETRGIENWKNDPSTGAHTDEGWSNPSKMCSSLFVDGETKLYISTSFYSEPELTINEIIIDDSKPLDCQKWFGIPYGVDSKTGNLLYVYDENAQYLVEQLFMDALKETNDDNLQVMTLVVIKSKNNEPQYDNYCGFAHLENQEVWFDADFAENRIIRAAFVDPPSPYCADGDHSCFCDLQEKLTGERKSYEEFFREHVSETCPIIPIPEDDNGLSFDPTKCEWIENEN
jgi:hypothetical protein